MILLLDFLSLDLLVVGLLIVVSGHLNLIQSFSLPSICNLYFAEVIDFYEGAFHRSLEVTPLMTFNFIQGWFKFSLLEELWNVSSTLIFSYV